MRKALASLVAAIAAPALAGAAELEIAGYGGYTFPFYSQTFAYHSGPVSVPIPGVSITQSGTFGVKASGAAAFAGGLAFYVTERFGFEVRYDHADIALDLEPSTYTARIGLPAPLEPIAIDLDLSDGKADMSAAAPFSINFKARTSGRVRLTVSGGASRLGDLSLTVEQTVALGITSIDVGNNTVKIGTIGVKATSNPGSSWGGNLGLGLQIPIGEHGAILLEGRGFYFPTRTVEWEPVVDRPLSPLELALLARLQENLPPLEFEPWWAQATVGVAIRF
jgi:hypothetical protein